MKIYARRDDFVCVLLEKQDWRLFREARLGILADQQEDVLFQKEHMQKPKFWKDVMPEKSGRAFCVLCRHEPLALTHVTFKDEHPFPVLTGSYRLSKCKGFHLGDLMYQARINYLLDETSFAEARTYIIPINKPSWEAAERNGFVHKGDEVHDGTSYRIYVLDLQPLRRARLQMNPSISAPAAGF